jgi:2-polyprenyl-3-methyl-5-hydroxy-6-metoxy-1,4-benzoquinol methylase
MDQIGQQQRLDGLKVGQVKQDGGKLAFRRNRMQQVFERLMGVRGMHFIASRFGGAGLRAAAFDQKFRNGAWNFDVDVEVGLLLERYGRNGTVLIMGCGAAAGLGEVDAKTFSSVLGVDISTEALQRASRHSAPNIKFQQCDMLKFKSSELYDLVVFSESLYYVPRFRRKSFLKKHSESLKPSGCFVVTVAQPQKFISILRMIRRNFRVVEDRGFEGSNRHLIVFRPEPK